MRGEGRKLGRCKCSAAISLSLCAEYNENVFRRKRFFYLML